MKKELPSLKTMCWIYFVFTLLFYLFFGPYMQANTAFLGYHGPWHLILLAIGMVDSGVIPGGDGAFWVTVVSAGLLALGFVVALVLACFKKYRLLGIMAAVSTGISLGAFLFLLLRSGGGIRSYAMWQFMPGILLNTLFCVMYFLRLRADSEAFRKSAPVGDAVA